jgi:ketosteroid isomerase-like protein
VEGRYGNPGALEADVTAVRAIYAAFGRRDIEAALAYVAPDVELFPSGTASRVGRTEPYRGHDGVREYFADAARVWDDLTLHADDIRAAAASVVVFGYVDGRIGGEPVRRRVIWTWRFRDGRAVSLRVHDVGEAPPA